MYKIQTFITITCLCIYASPTHGLTLIPDDVTQLPVMHCKPVDNHKVVECATKTNGVDTGTWFIRWNASTKSVERYRKHPVDNPSTPSVPFPKHGGKENSDD